jgi:hypothetical protein
VATRKARCRKTKRQSYGQFWSRFSPERCTNLRSAFDLLEQNVVSLSVTGPCTHRHLVGKITLEAEQPISIESLPDTLDTTTLIRGRVCFGYAGDLLDQVAENYPDMRWWISDNGLHMAIVRPGAKQLSSFDELGGRLTSISWKDGKLCREALWEIVRALDEKKFSLKDELQPKQWKEIAEYNQKWPHRAIKTFEQAARNPRFVCSVRRRLYVARQKFAQAHSALS